MMDKKEVLERSRRENRMQDEMERTVRIAGESFSVAVTMAVGVLIMALKFARELPVGDTLAMFWATTLGCALYQAWRLKKRSQIGIALFALAMIVYNLIRYFHQGW